MLDALSLPGVEAVFLVVGASSKHWNEAVGACTELFADRPHRSMDLFNNNRTAWYSLLRGGSARPLSILDSLTTSVVANAPMRIDGEEGALRCVRVTPESDQRINFVPDWYGGDWPEGIEPGEEYIRWKTAAGEGPPPTSGLEPRAPKREVYPKRITDAWLAENVPGMSEEDIQALLVRVRQTGWTAEEIDNRILPPQRPRETEAIEDYFTKRFETWDIRLPSEAVRRRLGGHIFEAGWHIGFIWGTENGEEYLEFLAQHRMTDDRRQRVYSSGRIDDLPVAPHWVAIPDGISPEKEAELLKASAQEHRRISAELRERGLLPPKGQNLPALEMNEQLRSQAPPPRDLD